MCVLLLLLLLLIIPKLCPLSSLPLKVGDHVPSSYGSAARDYASLFYCIRDKLIAHIFGKSLFYALFFISCHT